MSRSWRRYYLSLLGRSQVEVSCECAKALMTREFGDLKLQSSILVFQPQNVLSKLGEAVSLSRGLEPDHQRRKPQYGDAYHQNRRDNSRCAPGRLNPAAHCGPRAVHRSRALRARGFKSTSEGDGRTTFPVIAV